MAKLCGCVFVLLFALLLGPASTEAGAKPSSADTVSTATSPQAGSGSQAVEAPSDTTATPSAADTSGIAFACSQIRSGKRYRVSADFGVFEGQLESASLEGLRGLHPSPEHAQASELPDPVAWDRIRRVELQGTAAGIGARNGAFILGAVGVLVGLSVIAVASGSGGVEEGDRVILLCAGVGAGVGAALGAAIGSSGTSWRSIYRQH